MAESANSRDRLLEFLGTICRPGQSLTDVAEDTNLFDAGLLDSLAVIEIILFLEKNHGVNMAAAGIEPSQLGTLAGIDEVIRRAAE